MSDEFGQICSDAGILQGSPVAVPAVGTTAYGRCAECGALTLTPEKTAAVLQDETLSGLEAGTEYYYCFTPAETGLYQVTASSSCRIEILNQNLATFAVTTSEYSQPIALCAGALYYLAVQPVSDTASFCIVNVSASAAALTDGMTITLEDSGQWMSYTAPVSGSYTFVLTPSDYTIYVPDADSYMVPVQEAMTLKKGQVAYLLLSGSQSSGEAVFSVNIDIPAYQLSDYELPLLK